MRKLLFLYCLLIAGLALGDQPETLAPLGGNPAASNLTEMWRGFDPRAEPLETETLREWEEDGVVLRVVRFRVGVLKGQTARIAAVYGYPVGGTQLPGLVQIHGGGQYADAKACIANAKRGYATVSIAWAGRIASSKYLVNPDGVKRFWEGETEHPNYRLTTDWGAVDGYHAPARFHGNSFPSARPFPWTLDRIESARNSGWFLCAMAGRRALTFLEQQPEVDGGRLGVYGHSMGGKLTVLTAVDSRVKAAAPSCGGVSDRYNKSELFRKTLGDDVSLKQIRCPIIFLSPANDFHGRIVDLPAAVDEIETKDWRVTCSPQHSHQDTPPYEVATLLWFDQYLKESFKMPASPQARLTLPAGGIPSLEVVADASMPIRSVDFYYTQHAKRGEEPSDRELTTTRFWRHVQPEFVNGKWTGNLPISASDKPLLAYANVMYELEEPVSGAGYYYGAYSASTFNLSSLVTIAWADQMAASGVRATLKPTRVIETFEGDWQKEWFTYKPGHWARTTHKLRDDQYTAPPDAKLSIDVQSNDPNELVIVVDDYIAIAPLTGGENFQTVTLTPSDFMAYGGLPLADWNSAKRIKLTSAERIRPGRGDQGSPKVFGKPWIGAPPRFQNLRWVSNDLSRSRNEPDRKIH